MAVVALFEGDGHGGTKIYGLHLTRQVYGSEGPECAPADSILNDSEYPARDLSIGNVLIYLLIYFLASFPASLTPITRSIIYAAIRQRSSSAPGTAGLHRLVSDGRRRKQSESQVVLYIYFFFVFDFLTAPLLPHQQPVFSTCSFFELIQSRLCHLVSINWLHQPTHSSSPDPPRQQP